VDDRRDAPASARDPGPNSLRHFDQSVAALADTDLDVQTKMEIIALVDDYVFGFSLRAFIAVLETREEQAEPRMDAGGLRLHGRAARDRGLPPTSAHRRGQPRRGRAATRTSPRWPSTQGRFERGARPPSRRRRGRGRAQGT
jgi:hypothetical protein